MANITQTLTIDAMVNSGATSTNYGTATMLSLSTNSRKLYFNFDLSSIPAGSTIDSATLNLTVANGPSIAFAMSVVRPTASWTETGITWANQPATATVTGQSDYTVTTGGGGTVHSIPVGPTIAAIMTAGVNYGLALVPVQLRAADFWSAEASTSGDRPTLSVTYTAPATLVNYAATPATASATSPNAAATITYTPNASVTKSITADTWKNYAGTTILATDSVKTGTSAAAFFKPDVSGLSASDLHVVSATFYFDADTAGAVYTVESIDADWAESGAPSPAKGAVSLPGGTTTATYNSSATNSVDITSLFKEWVAGTRTNYGFALTGSAGSTNIASREHTTQNVPQVVVAYYQPGVNVSLPQTPATASGTVVDATVAAGTGASPTVSAASGSALLVAPSVVAGVSNTATAPSATAAATMMPTQVEATADPDVGFTAEVLTATAGMGNALVSLAAAITADPAHAETVMTAAEVASSNDAAVQTTAMRATALLSAPEEARGDEFDPYFVRLASQLGTIDSESTYNDYWFRLDETSGVGAENRVGIDGTYHNVELNTVVGPEGRRAAHFNGTNAWIEVPDNDHLTAFSRMEMVFRTTKATQTLATGEDFIFGLNAGFPRKSGLEMWNGVLRLFGRGTAYTGRTRIDDGEWHHVVWTMDNGTTRIYIDGKLEIRRSFPDGLTINAVIDGIGGGPDRVEGQQRSYDPALFFEGDIMEFVYDKEGYLSPDDVTRNFYAVFGIVPIEAGTAGAVARMAEAKGKGNQKRALALFYYPDWDKNVDVANHNDTYNWTGLRTAANSTGLIRTSHYGQPVPFEIGGYKVFPKSIVRNETAPSDEYLSGAYFDEVTGENRYIDISKDIDATDYDMVFFINHPPRFNYAAGFGDEPAHLNRLFEDMVEGVRKVVDEGVSMWCPQPEIAVALGVVDRVEAHSMRRETTSTDDQGNALGLFDARGAAVNPWAGGEASLARYYYDTHALNRHRVVAKVDGLTSHGGYVLEDYFYGRPRDPYKVPFEGWKYKKIDNGLNIGDEVFYQQDLYALSSTSNSREAYNKRRTVISVPASSVRAGTVVTRENATHYVGTAQVDNPWKDNATSIVVVPGDTLKGSPVGGKIYVNFMDGVDGSMIFKRQIVPPNNQITQAERYEDDLKRSWDYSSWRVNKTAQSLSDNGVISGGTILLPYGTAGNETAADYAKFKDIVNQLMQGKGNLIAVQESEEYPVEFLLHMNMIDRGLAWLGDRQVIAEGDEVVRVSAATATASAPEATVTGQNSVVVTAGSTSALATLIKPSSVLDPDVEIRLLPMTATARMTGYGKTIAATVATATAELVENFDMVMAGGEQVVLYLHHSDATLYILEED